MTGVVAWARCKWATTSLSSGPHQLLNFQKISRVQIQNSKRCSSKPVKFMKMFEVIDAIKGNFPFGLNIKFETYVELQIQKRSQI
jgi:hypothetical protein